MIASCGHECDETVSVIYSGEDCTSEGFVPCVFFVEYCRDCAEQAKAWPEYLESQEAADAWLGEQRPQEPPGHPLPWSLYQKSDLDFEYHIRDKNRRHVLTISEGEPALVDWLLSRVNEQ